MLTNDGFCTCARHLPFLTSTLCGRGRARGERISCTQLSIFLPGSSCRAHRPEPLRALRSGHR